MAVVPPSEFDLSSRAGEYEVFFHTGIRDEKTRRVIIEVVGPRDLKVTGFTILDNQERRFESDIAFTDPSNPHQGKGRYQYLDDPPFTNFGEHYIELLKENRINVKCVQDGRKKDEFIWKKVAELPKSDHSRSDASDKGPAYPEPKPASEFKGKIDIGIITIIPEELQAVAKRLGKQRLLKGRREYFHIYYPSTIPTNPLSIAYLRTLEQGQTEAAIVARSLIDDLAPRWILLVGICGAFPSKDTTLGDVIVAQSFLDFSISARLRDGKEEFAVTGGSVTPEIRNFLANLPARHDELGSWNSPEALGEMPPLVDVNDLYGDDSWQKNVKEALQPFMPSGICSRQPKYILGQTASSNVLVKDADFAEAWRNTSRQLVNIEMELTGVYKACQENSPPVPLLAVRGISDIVGHKRDDGWKTYAANTAASFTASLLPLLHRPL